MNTVELNRNNFIYTSCYCEENIYQLLKLLKDNNIDLLKYYAMFISNTIKQVPLLNQSSSKEKNGLVIWDYHVVLLLLNEKPVIYDFDTRLGFCNIAIDYLTSTVSLDSFKKIYNPYFRIIPAYEYLDIFTSDRSHMLKNKFKPEDGYLSKPPNYKPIINTDNNNLYDFIDMKNIYGNSKILNYNDLIKLIENSNI